MSLRSLDDCCGRCAKFRISDVAILATVVSLDFTRGEVAVTAFVIAVSAHRRWADATLTRSRYVVRSHSFCPMGSTMWGKLAPGSYVPTSLKGVGGSADPLSLGGSRETSSSFY